jgi:glutamine synthetase type III
MTMQTPNDPWYTLESQDIIEATISTNEIEKEEILEQNNVLTSWDLEPEKEIQPVNYDISVVVEEEFIQSMKDSIAAIPDIILEFKSGYGVEDLSQKYGFEKEIIESIIRLSFRIRVLKST